MPKASRRSPRHTCTQSVPTAPCFNIDRNSGNYFLLSSDGRKHHLDHEPRYEAALDVPTILTLLTTGKPKIILCAPPTILLIEPPDFSDLTRSFEGFGCIAPRTVAVMQAQGWLHGDGVFGLTDKGIAAATTTLPSGKLVPH